MGYIYRVGNKCMSLNCLCCQFDNRALEEDDELTPPLHDGCDCFFIKEEPRPDSIMRRPGKFEIADHMIERWPDEVQRIMARCIVTRAEYIFHRRVFEYVAYSRDFEAPNVPYGDPIPILEYVWEFNSEKGTLRALRTDSLPSVPVPGLDAVLAKAEHNE